MSGSSWKWFCGTNSTLVNDAGNNSYTISQDECFVDGVVSIPPAAFTVIAVIVLVVSRCCGVRRPHRDYLVRYPGHALRWVATFFHIVGSLAAVGEGVLSDDIIRKTTRETLPHLYITGTLFIVSSIISIVYYTHLETWRRKTMSWLLLLFWTSSIGTLSFRINHYIVEDYHKQSFLRYHLTIVLLVGYIGLLLLELNFIWKKVLCSGSYPDVILADLKKPNMKYLAKYSTFLSELVFWWENWLFKKGYKKAIEIEDLGCIPEKHSSTYNHHRFQKVFRVEKERCERLGRKINILKIIVKTQRTTIFISGLLKLVGDILSFIGPLSISGIIVFVLETYAKPKDTAEEIISPHVITVSEFFANGYVLIGVVFISALIRHVCDQYFQYLAHMDGLYARCDIQSMVYQKSMRISTYALSGGLMTMGQITNHMSVDANNVMFFFRFMHELWSIPFKIIITTVLIYYQIGSSALIACSVLLITIPLQMKVGITVAGIIKHVLKCADTRLKLSNELLQGIKLMKLYGWEDLFYGIIERARESELGFLLKQNIVMSLNSLINASTPTLVTFVAFATFTALTGKPLTPDIAFTTTSLIFGIIHPLFMLPIVIHFLVICVVSCRRINAFILAPEIERTTDSGRDLESSLTNGNGIYSNGESCEIKQPKQTKTFIVDEGPEFDDLAPLLSNRGSSFYGSTDSKASAGTSFHEELPEDVAIRITNGNFTWDPDSASTVLSDINLDIPMGKLTIIVGAVGSGKSSLLQAILGEMTTLTGKVFKNRNHKSMAFAAQKAWLVNTSLKENVLFGEPLRDSAYRKVIGACALQPDIDMLPAGDQTEIGEKGINLSGGQKQRVSVARALYSGRDIIIMDDPLSALDVHVGANLFEKGIIKMLKKETQTVILVTHQLQYLPEADQIIVMKDGRIATIGSPDQVAVSDPNLCIEWSRAVELVSGSETESGAESEGVIKERIALRKQVVRAAAAQGNKEEGDERGRLVVTEEREKGSVSYKMYMCYYKAMGYILASMGLLFIVISASINVSSNVWVSAWSEYDLNLTGTAVDNSSYWIGGYAGFSIGYILCCAIYCLVLAVGVLAASRSLHYALLRNIIQAPVRFFETTPIGRILNRLSSDVQMVDQRMMFNVRLVLVTGASLVSCLVVQVLVVWYFVLFFIPISAAFIFLIGYYMSTSRELQRLESISRSPIFAHFSETLGGLSTIRAYGSQRRFEKTIQERINTNCTVFLYLLTSMRWVGIRLDFLADFVVFLASMCTILGAAYLGVDPSLVGLAITYSLQISINMNMVVNQSADLELQMNAVERLQYYTTIPTENYEGLEPPRNWPSRGEIELSGISVRYSPELDPVLHNFSLKVAQKEKIGICGRTGSGKSSMTLALFRMIDTFEGRILIDGIDIASVPLRTLRQRISIIPQDAVLFTGTIRSNLDPYGTKEDSQLWEALETAQLKEVVTNIGSGLDCEVTEGGENFSVGQRQLFCLARAFLRNSKIIVMDEATASIDQETDRILQDVVADVFQDRTVLTIAHRVATILNSDSIVTLKDGRIVEFDSPEVLLGREDSIFASLVKAGK